MMTTTDFKMRARFMMRVARYERLKQLEAPEIVLAQELDLIGQVLRELTPLDMVKILNEEWKDFDAKAAMDTIINDSVDWDAIGFAAGDGMLNELPESAQSEQHSAQPEPICARVVVFAAENSAENSVTVNMGDFYPGGVVGPRLRLTVQLKTIDGAGLAARAVLEPAEQPTEPQPAAVPRAG